MPDIGAHEVTTTAASITAVFSASPTSGTAPLIVTLDNLSSGATSYSWNFGDGSTSTLAEPGTHTYASPGTYTITLTATGAGGTATTTQTITVTSSGGGASTDCANNLLANGDFASGLANWSTSVTGSATSSSGQAVITITGTGTFNQLYQAGLVIANQSYTLSFKASGPAGAIIDAQLIQHVSPFASLGLAQSFTISATLTTYSITFTPTADSNARFRLVFNNVVGTYTLDDVCLEPTDTSAGAITAGFSISPTAGTEPVTVTVTDTSTSTNGVTTYLYDWGDGTTSGTQNPTHVYMEPGIYTITQTVTGPDGTDSTTQTVTVNTASCGGNLITNGNFLASSATGWTWTAGPLTNVVDGGAFLSTGAAASGIFYQDGLGITSGLTYNISYWLRRTAGTANVIVTLQTAGGVNLGYSRTISPNSTFTEYTNTFTATGTDANARLVFTANAANSEIRIDDVCMTGQSFITANFSRSPDGGAVGTTVAFLDQSTSNNPITTRVWEYSSNNGSTWTTFGGGAASFSSAFNTVGTYLVRLTATSASGTDVSDTQTITIVANTGTLTIALVPVTGCAPLSVSMSQTINTNGSTSGATIWESRPGTSGSYTQIASGTAPSYVFSTSGSYQVRARQTVVYTNGTTEELISNVVTVTVNAVTDASFTTSQISGTAPLSVTFTNTSSNATSYSWAFGDGSTSTTTSPTKVYATAGTYTVTLTAAGECGSDTATQVITVLAAGTAPCFQLLYRVCGETCVNAIAAPPGAGYVLVSTSTGFEWQVK